MAEKSKIKSKKWVVALAVLVALAIIAVVIVLVIPKNVNDVKGRAREQETTMFLQKEDEKLKFEDFLGKIDGYASEYSLVSGNAKKVSVILTDVMHFYNDYIVFAESNSTFQSQYRVIMNGFKNANKYQKQMDDILDQVYTTVKNSKSFTDWAWQRFAEYFQGYVTSYIDAFEGLALVYRDCIPQGTINNALTDKVLNTVNDYLAVVAENKFESAYYIAYTQNFVAKYVTAENSVIYNYEYSKTLQSSLEKINTFSNVYKNSTLRDVIRSIDNTGITYKKTGVKDEKDVLSAVKDFLQGGLKV